MIIQGSIFGAMADRNQWSQFSCIKEDGTLDTAKYTAYIRMFANQGANSTRELPFLVTDKEYDKKHPGGAKQRNFLPFVWEEKLQAYDLNIFNQTYFDNLKEMIKIANRHNMSFQFSIFDRCHSLSMPDSPWKLNLQDVDGYYFPEIGDSTYQYARRYTEKALETVKKAEEELKAEGKECRMLFELENEPMKPGYVDLAVETLKLLIDYGYRKDQVEDGVFYLPYEGGKPVIRKESMGDKLELVRSKLFENLKNGKRKAGLYPKRGEEGKDKSLYFSTIHDFAASDDVLDELGEALETTRRFSLSDDGEKPKPGAEVWKNRVKPLFEKVKERRGLRTKIDNWKFEHLYRGDLDGNSDFGDRIDGIRGITGAYIEAFGEGSPTTANYGQYEGRGTGIGDDIGKKTLDSVRVTRGYIGILGRDPDPEGKKDYVDFLEKGGTLVQFCKKLIESEEFKIKSPGLSSSELAVQVYRGILDRDPDEGGLNETVNAIENGRMANRVAAMLSSPEFEKRFPV